MGVEQLCASPACFSEGSRYIHVSEKTPTSRPINKLAYDALARKDRLERATSVPVRFSRRELDSLGVGLRLDFPRLQLGMLYSLTALPSLGFVARAVVESPQPVNARGALGSVTMGISGPKVVVTAMHCTLTSLGTDRGPSLRTCWRASAALVQ